MKTVKETNFFGMSVVIEHIKTVTILSNPLKQKKPNKKKTYTESKAVDFTLQLDLIKRHILPKNVHNIMKLKLRYFKSIINSLNLQGLLLKMSYFK